MEDTSRGDAWLSLCELASKEPYPHKLLELITSINRALEDPDRMSRTGEASVKVDTVFAAHQQKLLTVGSIFYRFPAERPADLEYDC